MSKLTKGEVKHVAKLAKLKLNKAEEKKFKNQLSKVIAYIDELSEVNTSNIAPTSQTTCLTDVFSKDEVESENVLSQDEALSGTEKAHNGYFLVPGILEKDQ
jgi:aspartyl-tRNA(Asn)/glutamyl-tRNA(Gln) amidotransferase subunit C